MSHLEYSVEIQIDTYQSDEIQPLWNIWEELPLVQFGKPQ